MQDIEDKYKTPISKDSFKGIKFTGGPNQGVKDCMVLRRDFAGGKSLEIPEKDRTLN